MFLRRPYFDACSHVLEGEVLDISIVVDVVCDGILEKRENDIAR